jgi:RNA polymerase sigma factor (sigma-70 family)
MGEMRQDPGSDDRSDAELLRGSAEEPEAFGLFYDRHAAEVLKFFYRRTACAQTAADLTAETFAQAFGSRKRFRDTGIPARAWLFGIAHHQLAREARGRRISDRYRRRLGMEPVAVDDVSLERIEALADFAPVRDQIRGALRLLPASQSAAVVLRVGCELSYDEVAQRLGCSPGAARVRVTRGLTRLANLLEAP